MNNKVMSKLLRTIAFITLLSLASCQSKERVISQFDSFVEDVEQNGEEYSADDWELSAEEYEEFLEELNEYEGEFTKEDYKQIGRITARYHKAILTMTSDALKNGLDAGSSYMEGYMEEMGDGEDLDRFADDFDDLMEETIDEINEIFE